MIVCSARPDSLLKAALFSELTGLPVGWRDSGQQPDLFALAEKIDADTQSLPHLLTDLADRTGADYSWLSRSPGRRLALMILFNLRNQAPDSVPVIIAALAEALKYGPGYCLCGRGRASAVFRRRSREVGTEIHRMMGLIRFEETADGVLVARPQLFHQTADILLRKFQLRYPGRRLVFILTDAAFVCGQGQVRQIEIKDLPPGLLNSTDDFLRLWETYYRSQYIPARKNIRLASHFIPKKYWDWLPEGKILEQEAKK